MAKVHAITLPSGRSVKFREPNALDLYRIQGALPDLGDTDSSEELDTDSSEELDVKKLFSNAPAMIKTACVICVDPVFWADLRPDAEIDQDPRSCPAGKKEFDLDMPDLLELIGKFNEVITKATEDVRPLPKTAPVS